MKSFNLEKPIKYKTNPTFSMEDSLKFRTEDPNLILMNTQKLLAATYNNPSKPLYTHDWNDPRLWKVYE